MKKSIILPTLAVLLVLGGCFHLSKMEMTSARNSNVCKKLKGEVLLYAIFVDTKAGGDWGHFDMIQRQDALGQAVDWLHDKAMGQNIDLQIRSAYCNDSSWHIKKDFNKRGLTDMIVNLPQDEIISKLNKWANYISKQIGLKWKNPKIKTLDNFVAQIRNDNHVDNLGVIFMTNNYYKAESSIAINTNSNSKIEFAIISNNNPVGIAHEILHLFGAVDFYKYPSGKQYWENKDLDYLKTEFPFSIMHLPEDKDPKSFQIDPFTKYCIGWTDSLESKYEGLIKGKTKVVQKVFNK
jgi:hypothetical protein